MKTTLKRRATHLSGCSILAQSRRISLRHEISKGQPSSCSLAAYSSSSNPNRAPAAPAPATTPLAFEPFFNTDTSVTKQLFRTLPPLTVLPTPLPEDASSPIDSLYFPRSQSQEAINIIDACLYNCHDVRRAQTLLHSIRQSIRSNQDVPSLDVSIYNKFILAYIEMASDRQPEKREDWIKEAWDLYHHCINDGVGPDAATYAWMLVLLARLVLSYLGLHQISDMEVMLRFSSSILAIYPNTHSLTFESVLSQAHAKHVPIPDILLRIQSQFDSLAEREIILTRVGQWAVQEGVSSVLKDLGAFQEAGSAAEDPVAAFPVVRPVVKPDPELLGACELIFFFVLSVIDTCQTI